MRFAAFDPIDAKYIHVLSRKAAGHMQRLLKLILQKEDKNMKT